MDDDAFDSLTALRVPADYPLDAHAYGDVLMIARRRQSVALRDLVGGGIRSYGALVDQVNAVLGDDAVTDASLRNMRAGTSAMPPRVAVALARILHVDPVAILPHIEAFPWLGGRFRSHLAGRTWGEIAARFDVPMSVVAPSMGFAATWMRDAPPVPVGPSIAEITRSISRRTGSSSTTPVHDPVPVPSRRSAPGQDAGTDQDVMMSITDVGDAVRLVYRGLMDVRRIDLVRDAAGPEAWSRPDAWSIGRIEGRTEPLFVCDMLVPASRAPRLLSAIGSPVRRRGLFARLLGLG